MSSEATVSSLANQILDNFIEGLRADAEKCMADKYIPKKIIRSGECTIVFWQDGSKTIVRRDPEDADNIHTAFCAALAKKIYGSNSQIKKIIERKLYKSKQQLFHEKMEVAVKEWEKKNGRQSTMMERSEIAKEYLHLL